MAIGAFFRNLFIIITENFTKYFYNYQTVAIMLILVGIVFILVERANKNKVAKVDAKGLVTAVAEGNVTITAQVGDKTATYDFTIGEVKLTSISLDETDITIHKYLCCS